MKDYQGIWYYHCYDIFLLNFINLNRIRCAVIVRDWLNSFSEKYLYMMTKTSYINYIKKCQMFYIIDLHESFQRGVTANVKDTKL